MRNPAARGAIDKLLYGAERVCEHPGESAGHAGAARTRENNSMKTAVRGQWPGAFGAALLWCAGAAAQTVVNGNFNQPAILGPGQSALAPGDHKMIITDVEVPNYVNSISGIGGWTYALPGWGGNWVGVWSDHGLSYPTGFSNGDGTMAAHINNWERTMSQTVAGALAGDTTITASFRFGTPADGGGGRAGTFLLIAGAMDAGNPDVLAPGASVLASFTIGNSGWGGAVPNATVTTGVWGTFSFSHLLPVGDARVGQPLTIAFRTLTGSVGSTYWDDISVAMIAVPEPPVFLLLAAGGAGLVAMGRRRRSGPR